MRFVKLSDNKRALGAGVLRLRLTSSWAQCPLVEAPFSGIAPQRYSACSSLWRVRNNIYK